MKILPGLAKEKGLLQVAGQNIVAPAFFLQAFYTDGLAVFAQQVPGEAGEAVEFILAELSIIQECLEYRSSPSRGYPFNMAKRYDGPGQQAVLHPGILDFAGPVCAEPGLIGRPFEILHFPHLPVKDFGVFVSVEGEFFFGDHALVKQLREEKLFEGAMGKIVAVFVVAAQQRAVAQQGIAEVYLRFFGQHLQVDISEVFSAFRIKDMERQF